ncbi:MAG TPA: transposase [Rubrivivax sp.]|nr:transposase [Rubrivivax sp.]
MRIRCSLWRRRQNVHTRRNVLKHPPQAMQRGSGKVMRQSWDSHHATMAANRLQALANSLQTQHPGAGASLREGLAGTLTLQDLGVTGALHRTLRKSNPIEKLKVALARYTRNVKH